MTRLVSCAESALLDASTAASAAIPPLVLMEDASVELWRALEPIARGLGAGSAAPLVAMCGPGNNGGDALALLRHARFSGLKRVAAVLSRAKCGELASLYASSLRALGLSVLVWEEERLAAQAFLSKAALIVDGLTGTGLRASLREGLSELAEAARASGAPIASIDLPSGLSDSFGSGFPLVRATWTLSVEPRKFCLYFPGARESCGEIIPIQGVFPAEGGTEARVELLDEGDLGPLAPLPPDWAYKGARGRLAVFAGSVGASGAAVLASRSGLASGAGLVALFASPELFPIVAPMLEAVMVKPEPEAQNFEAARWDAILAGPGWGRGASRLDRLAALLGAGLPAVLDADAIGLYRSLIDSGFSASAPIILTPHPGEFASLTDLEAGQFLANPPGPLSEAARTLNAVIVLKSQVTWIASPEGSLAVWDGRESGLGTAGSGDVLAGLAAGLLARASARGRAAGAGATSADAFAAAKAAVIAHGLAGREERSLRGWFEAGALVEAAARALGRRPTA